jgi:hypothetical protein
MLKIKNLKRGDELFGSGVFITIQAVNMKEKKVSFIDNRANIHRRNVPFSVIAHMEKINQNI